jgi:Putative prokaryotic signal transducing protein
MGLIKIFSGNEALAIELQEKIEAENIYCVIRNNNQINSASKTTSKPVELFIQETDFNKANPIIEEFRMSL